MKYSETIMRKVRGNLGLDDLDDTSHDEMIESMTKHEVLSRVCNWEGIIDYGDCIIDWISQIYGIDLDNMEE